MDPRTIIQILWLLVFSVQCCAQELSAKELNRRTFERRAVEAVIWGMPAVNFDLMAPKHPGPFSAYLGAYTDKSGDWLEGARSYKLHVPPDAPAKLFLVGYAL